MSDVPRARFVVRPVPTEWEDGRMAKGRSKVSSTASAAWFEKGALEAENGALWLVDADGVRQALPLPPNDGALYRIELPVQSGAVVGGFVNVFVSDSSFHRIVELPSEGFDDTDALSKLAFAAGLKFGAYRTRDEFPFTKQTLNLRHASIAEADRHHLPHLFGGH